MKKKILIIGSSAKEYSLARQLTNQNEVFVAPGSDTIKEFANCIDIREDSTAELLEFVMENGIDLTIPTSEKALKSNIVNLFLNNNQAIFAPTKEASNIVYDKASMKKTLYKLRILTPKFGIFEKPNMVMDYVKNLKNPFVIKTNDSSSATILTSAKSAKIIVDSFFTEKIQKVIIEDYVWGTPFSFYTITDGYKALPLGSSIMYKHSLEGDGGQLTSGMGSCAPNYKLSNENEYFLMDNVIYPILENLERNQNPYIGILGINGILTDDGKVQVLGFETFMQDADCDSILNLVDTNLYNLFESCIIGSFSDEVEYIPQKDLSSTSIILTCKTKDNKENVINGLEELEEDTLVTFFSNVKKNKYLEYEAENGSVMVITKLGRTTATSTQRAYEEVENIDFKGLSYRKDICKPKSI